MRTVQLCLIFLSIAQLAIAQTSDELKQKYSELIQSRMEKHKVKGVSVAVVNENEVLWQASFGQKDQAGGLVNSQTHFKIGSISKAFTAMAILNEVQKGKIDLDAKVSDYLPGFKPKLRNGKAAQYTIRQVLTHKAGLPSDIFRGMYSDQYFLEVVDELEKRPNAEEAGKVRAYSNVGFSLLGAVLESITNMPYLEYIQSNIYQPMGLVRGQGETSLAFNAEGDPIEEGNLRDLPAGGLQLSNEDAAKFMQAVICEEILSKDWYEEMFKPQLPLKLDYGSSYGLPWQLKDHPELGRIATHGGDTRFFHSYTVFALDKGLGITIMTNSAKGSRITNLATDILKDFSEISPVESMPGATQPLVESPVFEVKPFSGAGEFANVIGIIDLKDTNKKNIKGRLDKYKFKMLQQENGKYLPQIYLLGILPVKDKETRWYFSDCYNKKILVQEADYGMEVLGYELPAFKVFPEWTAMLGKYEIVNPLEGEQPMIKDMEILQQGGRLYFRFTENFGGSTLSLPLQTIDNRTAYNVGWGRYGGYYFEIQTEGENLYLTFSGYQLKLTGN